MTGDNRRPGQLGTWHLVMLALGTVVGGSFFLGSSIILRNTGPGILLAFALGGLVIFLVLRALSELTVGRPAHGSFRAYAEQALGPGAGFVVGWLYWTGLVLAMSSEATAVALFLRFWFPALPLWLLSSTVVLLVTGLNLLTPNLFGRLESLMAGVKIGAVILFILFGLGLIAGLVPGQPPLGLGALAPGAGSPGAAAPGAVNPGAPGAGGWLPTGAAGIAGSMLLVVFTYAGFEVIGFAAPDTRRPEQTVPRAILITTLALVGLYMLTFAVILPLLPIAAVTEEAAPMVMALQYRGWPRAAGGLNLVVMSAALSTMLAAMYGLGRMLYSLAQEGQAPAVLGRMGQDGVPRPALLLSGAGMLAGAALAYLLPRRIYLFLASSGGFALLFTYLLILISQLRLRARYGCPAAGCQMPAYPYSTWLGILLMLAIILSMPLVPGQGAGLVAGLLLAGLFTGLYWLNRRRPLLQGGPAGRTQGVSHGAPQGAIQGAGPPDEEGLTTDERGAPIR